MTSEDKNIRIYVIKWFYQNIFLSQNDHEKGILKMVEKYCARPEEELFQRKELISAVKDSIHHHQQPSSSYLYDQDYVEFCM